MSGTAFRSAFRAWFALSDREAEVLGVLYEASGDYLNPSRIAMLAGVQAGSVKVHIHRIRQALDSEAVDCAHGGYALTEPGVSECRAVLWTIGEELRRAG